MGSVDLSRVSQNTNANTSNASTPPIINFLRTRVVYTPVPIFLLTPFPHTKVGPKVQPRGFRKRSGQATFTDVACPALTLPLAFLLLSGYGPVGREEVHRDCVR